MFTVCAFKSVLTPGDWINPCSFIGKVSEVACHYLFPRAMRNCLTQGHLAGFVVKAGLELMVS